MTISSEWRGDFVIQWNDGHPVEQFTFNAKESKLFAFAGSQQLLGLHVYLKEKGIKDRQTVFVYSSKNKEKSLMTERISKVVWRSWTFSDLLEKKLCFCWKKKDCEIWSKKKTYSYMKHFKILLHDNGFVFLIRLFFLTLQNLVTLDIWTHKVCSKKIFLGIKKWLNSAFKKTF